MLNMKKSLELERRWRCLGGKKEKREENSLLNTEGAVECKSWAVLNFLNCDEGF